MADVKGPSREAFRLIAPLVILAIGTVGFLIFQGRAKVPERELVPKDAPLVDTVAVVPFTDSLTIRSDGQVVPYQEAVLSAEVAGRVIKKADICRTGRFVKQGALLIEIDPSDYRLEKRRLAEEHEQAKTALHELDVEIADTEELLKLAEDDLELQQIDLKRQLGLVKSRATGAAVVDQAKRSVIAARNGLATLRKQINLLKARKPRVTSAMELIDVRLEQAELDLKRTQVTSPIDGIVVVESVEENAYVQKGTPLVTIEDTSKVEVRCHLRMDELSWIWRQSPPVSTPTATDSAHLEYQLPETPVTVVYRLGGRDYLWQGILWRYDGIGLNERTRTVPCLALVSSPRNVQMRDIAGMTPAPTGPPALVRGMFVALEIHTEPQSDLLQVPEIAVQPGNRVWKVGGNRLQSADVRVVEISDDVAILQADADLLAPGDRVVISPLASPPDGTTVRERQRNGSQSADDSELARVPEPTTP